MLRCEICDKPIWSSNKKGICSKCSYEINMSRRIKPAETREDAERLNAQFSNSIRYGIDTSEADRFQRKLGEI